MSQAPSQNRHHCCGHDDKLLAARAVEGKCAVYSYMCIIVCVCLDITLYTCQIAHPQNIMLSVLVVPSHCFFAKQITWFAQAHYLAVFSSFGKHVGFARGVPLCFDFDIQTDTSYKQNGIQTILEELYARTIKMDRKKDRPEGPFCGPKIGLKRVKPHCGASPF